MYMRRIGRNGPLAPPGAIFASSDSAAVDMAAAVIVTKPSSLVTVPGCSVTIDRSGYRQGSSSARRGWRVTRRVGQWDRVEGDGVGVVAGQLLPRPGTTLWSYALSATHPGKLGWTAGPYTSPHPNGFSSLLRTAALASDGSVDERATRSPAGEPIWLTLVIEGTGRAGRVLACDVGVC
jgi:uncharacterized protein affecting Mg2+/Co2+ transport